MKGALRPLLDAARRRAPTAYWRARNAWALGAWAVERFAGGAAYDEGFFAAHAAGDWNGLARVILGFAPARRVLDVGCGDGRLLAALGAAAPGVATLGLEGSPAGVRAARARGIAVEACDLARAGAGRPEVAGFQPELAVCLEVAEHLPPWRADDLVALLAMAPRVVFSAARPNQGGVLHVNEQPPAYWIRRFARRGMRLDPADGAFRAAVGALDLAPWYGRNVQLFVRA